MQSWGIPAGVGAVLGAAFKWWFPSRKELREERKANRERRIDASVLQAIANRSNFKGPRPYTGAGIWGVKSDEIAGVIALDQDTVADSLERLEILGKTRRDKGTINDPAPWWFIVPR